MGIDYSGVMLYGIRLTETQKSFLLKRWFNIDNEEEEEQWDEDDDGWYHAKIESIPEVSFKEIEMSYDGEREIFITIKDTYHESGYYDYTAVKRFEMDYKRWDDLLSKVFEKPMEGSWYIMSKGS